MEQAERHSKHKRGMKRSAGSEVGWDSGESGQSKVSESNIKGEGLFEGLVATDTEALLSKYPQHLPQSLLVRLPSTFPHHGTPGHIIHHIRF